MAEPLERPPEPVPPSLWRGVVFRVGFLYWMQFCLLVLIFNTTAFEEPLEPVANTIFRGAAWVGHTILGIDREIVVAVTGSGDRTVDWIVLMCVVVIAVAGGVLWALLDRRRAHDAWLRELVRIVMRYTLAFTVLGYGVIKLFFGQFPPPGPDRLLQPFGEASPMGLLWTFMGSSPMYVFFSGAAETVGALLLVARRTTLLGALVLTAVMTNVMMMNFCYDVPVKICSSHYLAMAIYLMLPDLGRLANVVLHNRPAQPRTQHVVLPKRWMQRSRRVAKYAALVAVIALTTKAAYQEYRLIYATPPTAAWYAGFWNVTSFHRNGQEVPASRVEPGRWRRLRFQPDGDVVYARWRTFDEQSFGPLYHATIDERTQTFTLAPDGGTDDYVPPASDHPTLRYRRIDADHLLVEGTIDGHELTVQLERQQPMDALLRTRGFHWINEVPYNR